MQHCTCCLLLLPKQVMLQTARLLLPELMPLMLLLQLLQMAGPPARHSEPCCQQPAQKNIQYAVSSQPKKDIQYIL
jgi:hypothetical protein